MSEVRQLYDVSLMDIPGRLRHLADQYEKDSRNTPSTFVWVEYEEDGEISVGAFGYAPQNKAQVVGILALAQRHFNHEAGDLRRGDHDVGELAPVIPLRSTTMKADPDPTEGGVAASTPSPAPAPASSSKSSKQWVAYAVGAAIVAVIAFLVFHH